MKVAIAGAGAVGRSIARELVDSHEVTLLERNPDHIDVDAIPAAHWRLGDACELSAAGVGETRGVRRGDRRDRRRQANVVVSLLAKTEFAVPRVVARVNDPRNEWLFDENWGVDVAVSTPRMLASLVEEAVAVGDLVRLWSSARARPTWWRSHCPTTPRGAVSRSSGSICRATPRW